MTFLEQIAPIPADLWLDKGCNLDVFSICIWYGQRHFTPCPTGCLPLLLRDSMLDLPRRLVPSPANLPAVSSVQSHSIWLVFVTFSGSLPTAYDSPDVGEGTSRLTSLASTCIHYCCTSTPQYIRRFVISDTIDWVVGLGSSFHFNYCPSDADERSLLANLLHLVTDHAFTSSTPPRQQLSHCQPLGNLGNAFTSYYLLAGSWHSFIAFSCQLSLAVGDYCRRMVVPL